MIGGGFLIRIAIFLIYAGIGAFVLWFAINGVIWIFRITFDRFGIDFTDHWTWFRSKLPKIKWKKNTSKIVETISETKGNEDEKPTV